MTMTHADIPLLGAISALPVPPPFFDSPPPAAPCPHREWSAGRPSYDPDIPAFAGGGCFPGDEAGPRCELSGEGCDPHPDHCPRWEPSELVCPACLEFKARRHPRAQFREAALLTCPAGSGEARGPDLARSLRFYCPVCGEEYANPSALFQAALDRLRDCLDDADFMAAALAEG